VGNRGKGSVNKGENCNELKKSAWSKSSYMLARIGGEEVGTLSGKKKARKGEGGVRLRRRLEGVRGIETSGEWNGAGAMKQSLLATCSGGSLRGGGWN